MTVVDLTWSFPDILIALIFVAIIGPGLTSTTFAIAIAYLAQFTRLTRAQIVRLKQETFIEATINLGAKPHHILLKHLLPNAIAPGHRRRYAGHRRRHRAGGHAGLFWPRRATAHAELGRDDVIGHGAAVPQPLGHHLSPASWSQRRSLR